MLSAPEQMADELPFQGTTPTCALALRGHHSVNTLHTCDDGWGRDHH